MLSSAEGKYCNICGILQEIVAYQTISLSELASPSISLEIYYRILFFPGHVTALF